MASLGKDPLLILGHKRQRLRLQRHLMLRLVPKKATSH